MERLKQTHNPCDECEYSYSKQNQESYQCKICEFKQYLDAERQGLILRLPAPLDDVESFEIADKGIWMKIPCRKGDTVYEIDGITWKGHDWKYRSYKNAFVKETVFRLEMLSEIGKTVFLTKEEAEQALERMEGEHE